MRSIVHNYDKAVFGSNMHAMMYAYLNQLPLFYSSLQGKPRSFEFFDPQYSFSNLLKNDVLCNNEIKTYGIKKINLWHSLALIHSMEGLMPLGNNATSARLDDEGLLKIITLNSRTLILKINHLYLFEENVEGLPETTKINNEGIIYDYFQFNSLNEHKTMFINTDEPFVNQIYINKKNGVVVTKVDELEAEVPDYAIKFRVLELAKQYNIKGRQNGIYHYKKELKIPRFLKLDLRFNKREIIKTKLNEYKNQNNLTFMQPTDMIEHQLIQEIQPNRLWNLLRSPHSKKKTIFSM